MKKVLIIIAIVLIVIEVIYCVEKKNDSNREIKNKVKIELNTEQEGLQKINKDLTTDGTNILSMWEDASNGGMINKNQMAMITKVNEQKFNDLTKTFNNKEYTDGVEAAKVESLYYKNSGDFEDIQEKLNDIETVLNNIKDKESSEYKKVSSQYIDMKGLLGLLENPQGELLNYRKKVYSKSYNME